MSDLSVLAQHAQTQAADTDLPDAERALWWQIAEEVIDYLEPNEVMVGEVTLEHGLFEAPIPPGPCQSCDQPSSTHYHLIGGGCMNSEISS